MSDLIKILLVEDDAGVCEGFRSAALDYTNLAIVYETGSEQQALKYLLLHPLDVIILDIELQEGDGVSLLETLADWEEKPFVALVTNNSSGILLNYMRTHGADYIYQKNNLSFSPAKVLSIIEKICPYSRAMKNRSGETLADRDPQEDRKRQYVEQKLFDMGFSRKQVGFPYIVEALLLLADDKPHGMTSEVYPMIAREYNVSKEGVERSIRSAIEVTFRHLNKEDRLRYYPFAYDEQKGRPSNTDFLVKFSEKLRLS